MNCVVTHPYFHLGKGVKELRLHDKYFFPHLIGSNEEIHTHTKFLKSLRELDNTNLRLKMDDQSTGLYNNHQQQNVMTVKPKYSISDSTVYAIKNFNHLLVYYVLILKFPKNKNTVVQNNDSLI